MHLLDVSSDDAAVVYHVSNMFATYAYSERHGMALEYFHSIGRLMHNITEADETFIKL